MAEPFIGEIRLFSFDFAPKGWAQCNGQILPIQQNQALYALLGTTFGGDGRVTFALPNLQARAAVHTGQGFSNGQVGGEENHTLTVNEMPVHTHQLSGSSQPASTKSATSNVWAVPTNQQIYANVANAKMSSNALGTSGGNQAHPNMQPYSVVNYCIALQGMWPPRN